MGIKEASDFLKSLRIKTDKKYEIKIFENFIGILSALKSKNLTPEQIKSIETELEKLELNARPHNRRIYYQRRLSKFKTYLKNNFSLITRGYYTAIGMSLGVMFGVVLETSLGMAFERSSGIALGLIIGLLVGRYMDTEAEKLNLVLK